MNWFEDWFDSPLYEKLYANRNEKEARQLVEFLLSTLSLNECSHILDLGCGRGRHSLNLAREGYRVKGIDLSEEAINKARRKAEAEELNNVVFQVRDMRNPLPEKFDAIVNLFTTFGYFEEDHENGRVLDSVVSMLKTGGIFVLDYLNAPRVRETFVPEEEGEFQGIAYRINRYIRDNAIFKEIVFSGNGLDEDRSYTERVKLYDLEWFKRELDHRNLMIDHIYGDYRGRDYDPAVSPRLLIIAHLDRG